MKVSIFYKFKAFPYASPKKIVFYQQWNPLRKLSRQKKYIFRGRNRIFSIESKYPLPKAIFLKMVTAFGFKQSNFTFFKWHQDQTNTQIICDNSNQWKLLSFSNPMNKSTKMKMKTPFLNYSYYLVNSVRKAYSWDWNIFKYVFLKKIWILYNPSLVPGISRPFKYKKNNLIKIRALKGLNHLVGKCNLKFLFFILAKSWNMSNFTVTVPFIWNFSRTVDSLKANILLKIGVVRTTPMARAIISNQKILTNVNGFTNPKILNVAYTGDYFNFNLDYFYFASKHNFFELNLTEKHLIVSNSKKTIKNMFNQKTQKFQNHTRLVKKK